MSLFVNAPTLRSYQHRALDMLASAVAEGSRAPLLALPTGSGKTVIAAEMIRSHGGRALFLAPRRELVAQTSEKLHDIGVDHGVVLAGAEHLRNVYAKVQVASIDRLASRMLRRKSLVMPEFDLVILDEAHLSITRTRQRLLDFWPNALRVGLTATPTRKDGRALGVVYDKLIEPTTVAELTTEGYLAPARYFSLAEPDLARVGKVAGDYHQRELAAAVNQPHLVGDVVATWLARAPERRTVIFCASIEHAVAVADEFLRAGVAAEHLSAKTPQPLREATMARFRSGETQVLTNCFLASYEFDLPELSCVVLARPTKSLMLYLQMLGRGLRIAEGKDDCLVLDHSSCVHQHGFADDERAWTLEGDHALIDPPSSTLTANEPRTIDCPECSSTFTASRTCPECGHCLAPRGKEVETIEGELVEVGPKPRRDQEDALAFYLELRGIAAERNYRDGWAAHKFKERLGTLPVWEWNNGPALAPTLATRRWVKSRQIAFAKSRARQVASVRA